MLTFQAFKRSTISLAATHSSSKILKSTKSFSSLLSTYSVILICSDRHEPRLGENKRLEILREISILVFWRGVSDMQSGLISVHGVENHLKKEEEIPASIFERKKKELQTRYSTISHMAIVVQLMICELELIEADNLFHPLGTPGWRIWMNVNPKQKYTSAA